MLPMMKLRLARPELLIDINDLVGELDYIRIEGDELCIGAMARHADVLNSALVGEHFKILHDAERVVADPIVRNRGTVGGSLGQADPSEDLSAAFAAIHANVIVTNSSGKRSVSSREFSTGMYETVCGPAEMITEVRIPIRPGSGSSYHKVERRIGDWAVAAAGACVWMNGDTVTDVGIGVTAVGAAHHCSPEAEAVLRGKVVTDALIEAAGAAVSANCNPQADQRGPEDYKRHLAGELTKRALRTAIARSKGLA